LSTLEVELGIKPAATNDWQYTAERHANEPEAVKLLLQKRVVVCGFPLLKIGNCANYSLSTIMEIILYIALMLKWAPVVAISHNFKMPKLSFLLEQLEREGTKCEEKAGCLRQSYGPRLRRTKHCGVVSFTKAHKSRSIMDADFARNELPIIFGHILEG
jgi:hypothetical protein